MAFVKKVKRSVRQARESLHITSRNSARESRSSLGTSSPAPGQPSATGSSISVISSENIQTVSVSQSTAPHTLSKATTHTNVASANPTTAATHSPTAIPAMSTTGNQTDASMTWRGLKMLVEVLDQGADVFGPLKSAVGGVLRCVEIYERVGQGRNEYKILKQELDSLFKELSQYFEGPISPSITSSFHNLAKGIENELRVVELKGQRNTMERVVEASGDTSEIEQSYRRIQKLLQRLVLNANVSVWKIVDEQRTEQRLLRLSPSLSARYSSSEANIVRRGGCTPNTRVDVLKMLSTWAHGSDSEKIYWLNGMAGTGKTTVAYTLCEQLDGASKLAASFFCSRQLPGCRNANLIFPTIAYQLARFSVPFRFALSHAIELDPDVSSQQPVRQFKVLIFDPLQMVKESLPEDLVVAIDALDECEDPDSVGQILDILFTHAPDMLIKFFLTSRPEPQIRKRMQNRRGERTRFEIHLHDLDRSTVKGDIKTYLDDQLREMNLASNDLERFAERSGALFIYAATAVRYLSFENFSRGPDRLRLVLGTMISSDVTKKKKEGTPGSSEDEKDALGRNEEDVDTLYTEIMKAAMEETRLERGEKLERRRVLHTVVCAQEPMTAGAIAGLMGLDSSDSVHRAIQPLLSVIYVSEGTELVTTLHESFPNYLFDKRRSGDFHCDPAKHHGWLANRCFFTMKMPDPSFNICNLQSSYVFDEEVEGLKERVEQSISKELVYACRYWGAHLVVGDSSNRLKDGLSDFLENRFLLWMEILSLKQSLPVGANVLPKVHVWCQKNECSHSTQRLVEDGWSFITTYSSSPATRSTPHIYVSSLLFWPKERAISKCYARKMQRMTKIGGTAMQSRTSMSLAVCQHRRRVFAVAYSPDGTRIVSCSTDGVRIWDAHAGRLIHQPLLDLDKIVIFSVGYSPNGAQIVSGSSDKAVRIMDAYTGKSIGEPLRGHTDEVRSVVYSPDGARVVSGPDDMTLRIWDAKTGQSIGEPLRGHTGFVLSVAYSSDGARIISGSYDKTVRIWDAYTGQMTGEPLQSHTGIVNSVSCSPNGTRIVSGTGDGTVHIFDMHTGQSIGKPLQGHTQPVRSVAYSPDGSRIVSCSSDHTIRIWDARDGQGIGEPRRGHTDEVLSVAYSPDGARIVSCSYDKTVRIWDADTREITNGTFTGHANTISSVKYSPDGTRLVSGSFDTMVRIWDAHTGQMVCEPLLGHADWIWSVGYSPHGAHIVSCSKDMTVRIWDARTGQSIGEPLRGHSGEIRSVMYSPDGTQIVSGSYDMTVRIWDAQTGQSIGEPLCGHTGLIYSVAYSPDGTRIVSGSYDKTVRIWDVRTGQMVGEPLYGHTSYVMSVVYSPDGSRIVSGSSDMTVRIWDANTGQIIGMPLQGHTGEVRSVRYSPDGARIASCSYDKTVRIWDAHSGQIIGGPLPGHTDDISSIAYSPDGSQIASGSYDNTVRIWDAYFGLPNDNGNAISTPTPWVMNDAGWVVDEHSNPLLWVPSDFQGVLLRYPNITIISRKGSLSLDFSQAQIGELWQNCYRPEVSSGFI